MFYFIPTSTAKPINTKNRINGNNTKNHDMFLYPERHNLFKINVQTTIYTNFKTKYTKL